MKRTLEARFKDFCLGLSKKDRVAVLHHSDPDGFCSGLIVMKAIEKLSGKKPVHIAHYEYANEKQAREFARAVKKKKLNKLVLVDIAIDGDIQRKRIIKPFDRALILDHHKIYEDLNSEKVVFLKAGWFSKKDPAQYACSKFCFDMFGKVTNVSAFDWVACVGILGDMGFESWKSFVKKTMVKRKLKLDQLNFLLEMIAATEVMAGNRMNSLLNEFYKAKNPKSLLKSSFVKYIKAVRCERDQLVAGFDKRAEYIPEVDLFVYEFVVKRDGIKSYVVNEISQIHPNTNVVVIQDSKRGDLRISARRQDYKVRMNELMEKSIHGIPKSNAGGHIPAAAARIPKKFRAKFRANMIKVLKKMKKK